MAEVLLEGRKVTRYFGGLPANMDVDFTVNRGEILGLIGPNGSGKTTLINQISGILKPSSGEIHYAGRRIDGLKPYRITRMGIARTFQIMKPFSGMTVRENVSVGAMFGRGGGGLSIRPAVEAADEALEVTGLADKWNYPVTSLSTADRKRLELARALAMRPEMILLDEVMAGLNHKEMDLIIDLVLKLNQSGMTVLVVEHVMKVIMRLCHRVMVLQQGKRIALGTPQEVAEDENVISAYLGERYRAARANQGG